MSDENQGLPPRGLSRDLHRAREGTKASAEELREFVTKFRGKSPQEMLGLVAGSGLVRSTVLATVVTVGLMLVFTVWPYIESLNTTAQAAKPTAPAAAPTPAPAPAATAAAVPVATAATTAAALNQPSAAGVPKQPEVLDKLGIGETKKSDPKKNPLDSGTDDLFKELDKK